MSLAWLKRLVAAVALLQITLPTAAEAPANATLAGQLLIASPSLEDPNFRRTVILLVQHNRAGALGIVINRPIARRPLADLFKIIGEQGTAVPGEVEIFAGGPVQPDLGFVIHSAEYRRPETIEVDARVAMTSSRDILRDIAGNKGPGRSLVAFGYAGWSAGQLEGELKRQFWVTAPADPALIFDEEREKVYDSAFARRTLDL